MDGDHPERAGGILRRGHRERARAHLREVEHHRVVETLEPSGEDGRIGGQGVPANRQRRRDLRTYANQEGIEDVAAAGQGAPRGREIIQVIARARSDRQRRETGTRVEHAVPQAAGGDIEAGGELRLGAQLEDAGAILTDAARGTHDGLQGQARTQRRDVGHAPDRDGVDGDETQSGPEIQTPFDGGDRPDVLAGGHDPGSC